MNNNYIKSKTITPNNKKSFKKFNLNLNNLNLSLTNTIDNSSFIILKDGTIKPKRHKNSYFEGYLDNKRLLIAMDTESKIRRVKSCVNDNKKKNLFYKANCLNYKINNSDKRNSDTNIPVNLHRINMFENVFIDENQDNEFNGNNSKNKNRYSHNNYHNNLNLNFSYNDKIRPVGPKINNKNKQNCNCDKYDSKSKCKFHKNQNQNKINENECLIEKKNRYKNLWKYLNNDNTSTITKNKMYHKSFDFRPDILIKNENKENNINYNNYDFDKFDLTFKSFGIENEMQKNAVKYTPNNLQIINNEKIHYKSNISNLTPNRSFNKINNTSTFEQCRINTKNTNFVSKILSNEITPIRHNIKHNSYYSTNDNTFAHKHSIESIFNLSIMNRNNKKGLYNKNVDKSKNVIIFKNDNIRKYRFNNDNNMNNSLNKSSKDIPNYLHFDQLKNNYNYYERIYKNGTTKIIGNTMKNTLYNFKKIDKVIDKKTKEKSFINEIEELTSKYFNDSKKNNNNMLLFPNMQNNTIKEENQRTVLIIIIIKVYIILIRIKKKMMIFIWK